MHGSQHAGDKFVDSVTLLDQRHQRRDPAFVVGPTLKMGEDEFLEVVDLIL
jgi:hypothetical protein